MIEFLIELIGNWAIWKSEDLKPATIRRVAIVLLWLGVLVVALFVLTIVKLVG